MEKIKLNDICDVRDGTHDSPQYVTEGFPLVTSKNIIDGKIDISNVNCISEEDYIAINKRSHVDDGDILMPMIGTIGRPVIVKKQFDFAIKNVALIKFHEDSKITPSYVRYVLDSNLFKRYVERENRGGTQKFIALGKIRNFEVPLISLDKQNEITSILDIISLTIKKRNEQLALLDELIKSRFVEMFGDPVTNNMNWKKQNLKILMSKIGSGATPKGGKQAYKSEGISLIRSMNVHNDRFEYKDLAFIDDDQAERLNNVTIESGDVLLNITGASVARCCVVPENILPARVNQHVSILRCKNEMVPTFLNRQLTNESYQKSLWSIATSNGATREAITKQQLENLLVIVPPNDLQNQYSVFVKKVDKLKSEVQKSLDETQVLFDSLMQEYFE